MVVGDKHVNCNVMNLSFNIAQLLVVTFRIKHVTVSAWAEMKLNLFA